MSYFFVVSGGVAVDDCHIYLRVVVFKFERMRTETNVSFTQCKGTV